MSTFSRQETEQKVEQVIYGGDAYNAAEVFDESEYAVAKRMFKDYTGHPRTDEVVKNRAETAIEQMEDN